MGQIEMLRTRLVRPKWLFGFIGRTLATFEVYRHASNGIQSTFDAAETARLGGGKRRAQTASARM